MQDQLVEVQKSQEKMWDAISKMGEELRELVTRENSSEFEDKEKEVDPKDSHIETLEVSCKVTSPTPFFGILPIAPIVSFRTFDAASVKDSVSSVVPRQSESLI